MRARHARERLCACQYVVALERAVDRLARRERCFSAQSAVPLQNCSPMPASTCPTIPASTCSPSPLQPSLRSSTPRQRPQRPQAATIARTLSPALAARPLAAPAAAAHTQEQQHLVPLLASAGWARDLLGLRPRHSPTPDAPRVPLAAGEGLRPEAGPIAAVAGRRPEAGHRNTCSSRVLEWACNSSSSSSSKLVTPDGQCTRPVAVAFRP